MVLSSFVHFVVSSRVELVFQHACAAWILLPCLFGPRAGNLCQAAITDNKNVSACTCATQEKYLALVKKVLCTYALQTEQHKKPLTDHTAIAADPGFCQGGPPGVWRVQRFQDHRQAQGAKLRRKRVVS